MLSVSADLNIALGKPASMSSHDRRWGGPASDAVDGNRYGRFLYTNYENKPWVKIDLLTEVLLAFLTWLLTTDVDTPVLTSHSVEFNHFKFNAVDLIKHSESKKDTNIL